MGLIYLLTIHFFDNSLIILTLYPAIKQYYKPISVIRIRPAEGVGITHNCFICKNIKVFGQNRQKELLSLELPRRQTKRELAKRHKHTGTHTHTHCYQKLATCVFVHLSGGHTLVCLLFFPLICFFFFFGPEAETNPSSASSISITIKLKYFLLTDWPQNGIIHTWLEACENVYSVVFFLFGELQPACWLSKFIQNHKIQKNESWWLRDNIWWHTSVEKIKCRSKKTRRSLLQM